MIYYVIVVAICFLYLVFKQYDKKYFLILSFFSLFLLAAFRNIELWPDLVVYNDKYRQITIFSSLSSFLNDFLNNAKDPGFYLIEWLFSRFSISFQLVLAIIAAFFLYIVARKIYMHSPYVLISVLLFLALQYYTFSMSGLRQTIAITITVLAYFYLDKDKPKIFIALVLLAFIFHKSAIVFLLLLPIRKVKIGKYHFLVTIIGLVVFFAFQTQLKRLLDIYVFVDNYKSYATSTSTLNYTKFVILLAVFIFCMYYYKSVTKRSEESNSFLKSYGINNHLLMYNSLFIGVAFQLYSAFFAEMFRISLYFSLYAIFLVPLSLYSDKDRHQRDMFGILITLVVLAYIFISGGLGVEYHTCWS